MKSQGHLEYEQLDLLKFPEEALTTCKTHKRKRHLAKRIETSGLDNQLVIVVLTDSLNGYKNDIVKDDEGNLYAIKSTITNKNYVSEDEIIRRNIPVIDVVLTQKTLASLVATNLSEFRDLMKDEFFDELTNHQRAPDIRFQVSDKVI